MNNDEFKLLQSYSLDLKIMKTEQRIREWVSHFGLDGVYISFSGGKDSTVLLHIARRIYPEIRAVFSNTGLEYPEIVSFVKSTPNVDILRPKMTFKQVIDKYGYPVISKEQSNYIYRVRNTKSEGEINKYLHGINRDGTKTNFKVSEKWKYMVDSPFKISDKCCDQLKKNPFKKYEKETGRVPIIATLATESSQRKRMYLKDGCNAFENKRPKSTPMGFWTEQDVLQYIKEYNVPIASVYGDIIEKDGKLVTTGESRTGCIFCMYGIHKEEGQNRIQRLEETHPKLHDYCVNKLGLKDVLSYMNIEYSNNKSKEGEK